MFRRRVTRQNQGNWHISHIYKAFRGDTRMNWLYLQENLVQGRGVRRESTGREQFRMDQQLSIFAEITTPSPVRCLKQTESGGSLWVKDDSRIHALYGGNKCRKLAHLLRDAENRKKSRLTTFGAAGSHHVLATGLLGSSRGFSVRAFVIAQPWSAHAEQVLCASVTSGIELIPVQPTWTAIKAAVLLRDPKAAIIPPGGSNLCGAMGYFEAAIELAQQVKRGDVPEPDYIVAAFGTAGTVAGLLAGTEYSGLKSVIVGVSVLKAPGRSLYARRLANTILRSVGSDCTVNSDRLIIDSRWLGAGYGFATESGRTATSIAAPLDLPLDPTYTAKAFAGALSLVNERKIGSNAEAPASTMAGSPVHVLYWHTLDASRSDNQEAARAPAVPQKLRALLRPCPAC
jgi:D-cysteine desulfhydrase